MPLILRSGRIAILAAAVVLTAAPAPATTSFEQALARGDTAWDSRAEGHHGARAAAEPIAQAIAAYDEALAARPDSLEARWKLLRALYFKGEFVLSDTDARRELFEHGRTLADAGREQIERTYGLPDDSLDLDPDEVAEAVGTDDVDAAEIYFWSSTHWGLWGRYRGKIAAARQGVATKIRKFSEIVIRLNPTLEHGGGHRVLGRLNAEAPKIPLVTGWIDRDVAIAELERALEIAPGDLLTQVFLAEALLDYRPRERQRAIEMLEHVVDSDPDPEHLVEELKAIDDAKELLVRVAE